jgi:hypothetical protein
MELFSLFRLTGGDKISGQLFNFHVHAGSMNERTPGPQSCPQFTLKILPCRDEST